MNTRILLPLLLFSFILTSCDWFKPRHTIVFTHNTNGFLEDCGCSGVPAGGLHRRGAVIATASKADREAIFVDGGDVLSTYHRFPLRDKYVAEIMMMLQYDAIGIGEQELINGMNFYNRWLDPLPMISGNILNLGKNAKVIKRHGEHVALVSLINPEFLQSMPDSVSSRLIVADPKLIMTELLGTFKEKEIKNIILLSHLGIDLDKEMAQEFPEISLILSAHDQDPRDTMWVENNTPIFQNGPDGEFVGIIEGYFDEGKFQLSDFNRIRLDSTIYADSLVFAKIRKYYAEIDTTFPDLHPELSANPSVENCVSCHQPVVDSWLKTGHAHAFETLKKAGLEKDGDCLTCHSTHYGNPKFFTNSLASAQWVSVHCQQCHEVHTEPGAKVCTVTRERTSEADCRSCHTPERSPAFDYKSWVLKVHP